MGRNRSRNAWRELRRRDPSRDLKKTLLIYSEGKKTEPEYISAFARIHRNSVRVVIEGERGVPKTLVERAAARKKAENRVARKRGSNLPGFDEVWCVFDVDEHPKLPDAKQQARDNGILLAISNPCFELWALLHFQDQTAYVERDDAKTLLRQYLPDYQKQLPFCELEDGHDDAVRRAQALEKRHRDAFMECDSNPSTGVYRLVLSISEFGKGN